MVATILTSTTQPISDILPWGTPISVSSSSSADIATSNSRKCTTNERTLLITDAIANDGRFILNTLALQYLSSRHTISSDNDINNNNSTTLEGAVLWISCSSTAEKEIMLGLRKGMQHNLAGVGSNNNGSGRIHTVSIPIELADVALSSTDDQSDAYESAYAVSHEEYLKQLHKRIVHWLKYRELLSTSQQQQQTTKDSNTQMMQGPNLIVIDNATTLATMFGNRLASAFVSSVQSSLKKCSKISSSSDDTTQSSSTSSITTCTNLLAIRASSPDDGGLYQLDTDDSLKGEKLRSEYARLLRPWLGLGSGSTSSDANQIDTNILQIEEQSNYLSLIPQSIPSFVYTSGLYELVDCIVDVSPLESGYARDVLGRLSFVTTWNGKGWWGIPSSGKNTNTKNKKDTNDMAHASLCINYRCDGGVRVMRLRT